MYPGLVGFHQPNIPLAPISAPLISNRMDTASTMPAVNWLLSQRFMMSPLPPQPSISPKNYMLHGDEERRRRPFRIRELSPIWVPSQRNDQTLIPVNQSIKSAVKIISVVNVDPTGGSQVVTRRHQNGHLDVRVIYSREFIIAASASPYALLPPANFRQMVLEMMDIIAKFPKSYYNSIHTDTASDSSQ
ncbi:Uncharacterized protein BM_BM18205 [Brugia malayi]|uniref:Uncharacterized protein n=2 Tax=Brugia malayi TaxID=6279 RepID=A0A4E9FNH0_BRUMA|nr:Uncharacterized protein BM_BM18205 [Brugia malayi]VIO94433.1 Uncharacterized protein BM_BM18205 [Brugia malayi]